MAIPDSQLETWANIGPSAGAKAGHESIRMALEAASSRIKGKDYEVYLQGSYKNDTNIRADSDVDIVVQLNSTFQPNLSLLSDAERAVYAREVPSATYLFQHFRADVLQTLSDYYGAGIVSSANKCVVVQGASGRLTADVVPCLLYRHVARYPNWREHTYWPGISFVAQETGVEIVNYPKLHYDRGVEKNSEEQTNGWYKPTVRLFKNARNHLIANYGYSNDHAPSYFVECLLSNAPDHLFGGTYANTFVKILHWIDTADLSSLRCQNQMTLLFGSEPTQWNAGRAKEFAVKLGALWANF
jgi:hypothetical protein